MAERKIKLIHIVVGIIGGIIGILAVIIPIISAMLPDPDPFVTWQKEVDVILSEFYEVTAISEGNIPIENTIYATNYEVVDIQNMLGVDVAAIYAAVNARMEVLDQKLSIKLDEIWDGLDAQETLKDSGNISLNAYEASTEIYWKKLNYIKTRIVYYVSKHFSACAAAEIKQQIEEELDMKVSTLPAICVTLLERQ